MRFEEALPALREGKKIRLKEWKEIEYIYKPKNETDLKTEDYHSVNLSWKDFFSDNWEIVEEKKKVKLRDLTAEQVKKWIDENCNRGDYCKGCPFRCIECYDTFWLSCKDMFSDKFLDQEVEIED